MSRRRRNQHIRTWRRYQARYDRITRHQWDTGLYWAPIRTTPGFFRAEGWNTDRHALRHGA